MLDAAILVLPTGGGGCEENNSESSRGMTISEAVMLVLQMPGKRKERR
jgi:hypothetical protein